MKRTTSSSPETNHSSSQQLLTQARAFASHAFHSHVACVLRHVTVTCLRRLLSQRVRHHLRYNISQEQLLNSTLSIEEILSSVARRHQSSGASHPYNLLSITEEDIQHCYTVATRLGKKWAQVLQRQGYVELAELTLGLVAKGQFLEPQSSSSTTTTTTTTATTPIENTANNCPTWEKTSSTRSDYVSPYTALHALRRYPNDCDGSGLPSQHLPAIDDVDVDDAKSFVSKSSISARKVIQQIDTMAMRNDMTYWHYGWDAIEEAVQRNRQRIDYSRMGNSATAIDTLTSIRGNEEDEVEMGDGLVAGEGGDDNIILRRNSNHAADDVSLIKKSRKRGRSAGSSGVCNKDDHNQIDVAEKDDHDDCNNDYVINNNTAHLQKGRPPSSIGAEEYHRNDILHELTLQERKQLIESSIHPPFPYESDMMDGNDEDETSFEEHSTSMPPQNHHAVICGALKDIGQIHLWEQTRHVSRTVPSRNKYESTMKDKEENIMTNLSQSTSMMGVNNCDLEGKAMIYGVSEAQSVFQSQHQQQLHKRALARAVKERIGPRTISNAEYRAEYTQIATCSKVRRTEEEEITHDGDEERTSTARQWDQSDGLHRWLEMDIGECMIEVVDDDEQTTLESVENKMTVNNETKKKFFLGFRSLEMALKL